MRMVRYRLRIIHRLIFFAGGTNIIVSFCRRLDSYYHTIKVRIMKVTGMKVTIMKVTIMKVTIMKVTIMKVRIM